MNEKKYDVVVIGAGPAGYVAAIRCAQLGMTVACVDDWRSRQGEPALGGTCLNAGCIPSKALLDSSEQYHKLTHQFESHGIHVEGVTLDIPAMIARKDRVVRSLTDGIAMLFRANRIEWVQGRGRLVDGRHVEVTPAGASEPDAVLEAEHIILASGSRPITLDAAPVDGKLIVDSAGALEFQEVPKRLGVIGAGVIGLELGSVWRRLGAEVVVLEAREEFLPMVDVHLGREAYKQLTRQGLDIRLGARVISTQKSDGKVELVYQDKEGEHHVSVDRLVVAVGRVPNSEGLFAPETRLVLDEGQFIHVDEHCRTTIPGVYAVGDVVRGPMLAHKGSEEGVMVAETIAGTPGHVNYETVPSVIYTAPEIAWVGRTEQQLKAAGEEFRTGMFPFAANGRARAMEEPVGFVKILAHAGSDRILGVHIIGPLASEMIAEAVLAMEFAASAEDLARTIHAHPTLSESMHEAALAAGGRALHKAK